MGFKLTDLADFITSQKLEPNDYGIAPKHRLPDGITPSHVKNVPKKLLTNPEVADFLEANGLVLYVHARN
jgi:hypothetical protein